MAGRAMAQIGLGCMRLSTAPDRDPGRARATLAAAIDAGVRWLDTAPSYAHGEHELHHNEALIAEVLAGLGARADVVVATKVGLTRRGTSWVPDGRAKAIAASAQRSAEILGAPLDVLLLHAIDPAVPIATSMRALEALRRAGLAGAIGLCNPSRAQLLEALEHAHLQHVQVPLSVHDDGAERSGVLALCRERGLTVHAHTPLGGPSRSKRDDAVLGAIAVRHGVSQAQVAIAAVAAQGAIPLVGASRPETAAELASLPALSAEERATIAARKRPTAVAAPEGVEVLLLVGSQGAGKSRLARELVDRGYLLLSRDERGGTLGGLSKELAAQLGGLGASGEPSRGIVLDNTAGTRAQRAEMIAVARAAGAPVRAIWLDVPGPVAQANVVRRIVRVLGRLPTPEELRRSKDPRVVPPRALFSYARTFEPPEADEGLTSIERRAFVRSPSGSRSGLAISLAVLATLTSLPAADRTLVYGWAPEDADATRTGVATKMNELGASSYTLALCEHGGGPPICWCRPPLPGLLADWLEREEVDPARTIVVGAGRIDATLADAVGASLVAPR